MFSGVGKFKGLQVKIAGDPAVTPVAHPFRRIPFGLRDMVEAKLEELVEVEVIELVLEPTQWISPLDVVLKASGDIRRCVGMHHAN